MKRWILHCEVRNMGCKYFCPITYPTLNLPDALGRELIFRLFQYQPNLELSKLINNLKSVSSRKLRQEFSEHLAKIYWKDVFWNGSYFVASCGGVTISTLRKYIENQNSPEE